MMLWQDAGDNYRSIELDLIKEMLQKGHSFSPSIFDLLDQYFTKFIDIVQDLSAAF